MGIVRRHSNGIDVLRHRGVWFFVVWLGKLAHIFVHKFGCLVGCDAQARRIIVPIEFGNAFALHCFEEFVLRSGQHVESGKDVVLEFKVVGLHCSSLDGGVAIFLAVVGEVLRFQLADEFVVERPKQVPYRYVVVFDFHVAVCGADVLPKVFLIVGRKTHVKEVA